VHFESQQLNINSKSTAWIFPLHFQLSLACLKKPVFSKQDLLRYLPPARLYWDLLTSGRYQIVPSMIFDLFPRPTVLVHRSQITEGPVRRPLLLYKNTQAGQRRREVGFLLYVQLEFHCLKGFFHCPKIFCKKLYEFRAARVKLGRLPSSLVDFCFQRCCHWATFPLSTLTIFVFCRLHKFLGAKKGSVVPCGSIH